MNPMNEAPRVRVLDQHGGRLARLILDSPAGNALDLSVLNELSAALDVLHGWPHLVCVVLEGAGRDFSSGFSIPQRRAPYVELLLPSFHACVRRLAALPALIVAKVRGRCEGAGLELALLANAVLCDQTARFGFPDLAQGVFPPLGSLLLPDRIGRARAEQWLLTGRAVEPDEALSSGLVTACAGGWDNVDSLLASYLETHVLSRSNVALRALTGALRLPLERHLAGDLTRLEERYLRVVAPSRDAEEGLSAALHGRPPRWTHT